MFSVLVWYVEDGWIEQWLKPKTIKFVFTVQNYEISTGTFQRSFLFLFTVQFLMQVGGGSDEKAFKDFNPVVVAILDSYSFLLITVMCYNEYEKKLCK